MNDELTVGQAVAPYIRRAMEGLALALVTLKLTVFPGIPWAAALAPVWATLAVLLTALAIVDVESRLKGKR